MDGSGIAESEIVQWKERCLVRTFTHTSSSDCRSLALLEEFLLLKIYTYMLPLSIPALLSLWLTWQNS